MKFRATVILARILRLTWEAIESVNLDPLLNIGRSPCFVNSRFWEFGTIIFLTPKFIANNEAAVRQVLALGETHIRSFRPHPATHLRVAAAIVGVTDRAVVREVRAPFSDNLAGVFHWIREQLAGVRDLQSQARPKRPLHLASCISGPDRQ
jgi:hypothetical protein